MINGDYEKLERCNVTFTEAQIIAMLNDQAVYILSSCDCPEDYVDYMNAITILYMKLGCEEVARENYKDLQDEIKEAEERDD